MEEIFEIKDVDLYYGPKQVLKKVNLNLYKNKVTTLLDHLDVENQRYLDV